jgi:hypothetical protein
VNNSMVNGIEIYTPAVQGAVVVKQPAPTPAPSPGARLSGSSGSGSLNAALTAAPPATESSNFSDDNSNALDAVFSQWDQDEFEAAMPVLEDGASLPLR